MVLKDIESGRRVRLSAVRSGCKLQSRLAGMGLIPGSEVTVISNIPGRPIVLAANGSRLMLCQKIAGKIRVFGEEEEHPAHEECNRREWCMKNPDETCIANGEKFMCKQMCLRQMCVNQSGIIRSVKAQGELGRRIRDMGLIPNTEITVVGRAPLKDPVALRLRDFTLSLRNNEADYITVEVAGE